jgi:GDP/UDP-N,N'-diacetylbacillosamine 2-epimerase (hydrolysing)
MRKVCYISGTRADFGLMKNSLQAIDQDDELDLEVIVTGMHLLNEYGDTYQEILDLGLNIVGKVRVSLSGESGSQMSIALGNQIIDFTKILEKDKPDLVLLLGDRGEMLAGAIVSLYLNIPIVHIHGGELSGTVDDSVRHAISKLSHYHFTATELSKERLIKMGEVANNIFTIGAPGLDEIYNTQLIQREALLEKYGINSNSPFILFLFHPVVQQYKSVKEQLITILEGLLFDNTQILALMPNADAGGSVISSVLSQYTEQRKIKTVVHIERLEFLSLLSEADLLVGNSSSGIIEAASLGTPVINIGDRQNLRERNNNVVDVGIEKSQIINGINKARSLNKYSFDNVYGDGKSSQRIVELLKSLAIDSKILDKVNAY